MLLISSAAFYNVAQSYVVLWQTKEIYGNKPEQGESPFCPLPFYLMFWSYDSS
jgi:hypothetical protein